MSVSDPMAVEETRREIMANGRSMGAKVSFPTEAKKGEIITMVSVPLLKTAMEN